MTRSAFGDGVPSVWAQAAGGARGDELESDPLEGGLMSPATSSSRGRLGATRR